MRSLEAVIFWIFYLFLQKLRAEKCSLHDVDTIKLHNEVHHVDYIFRRVLFHRRLALKQNKNHRNRILIKFIVFSRVSKNRE